MENLDTIFLIGVVLGLLFWFIKWKFTYWQRNEIPFLPPKFPLGFIAIPRSKQQFSLRLASVYEKYRNQGPFVGLYFFIKPVILLTDVNMIRNVLIKDFSMFASRGVFVNEKADPLSAHLFNLDYEKWRPLRAKLTPTFTSGKMKFMFPTIVSVSNEFVNCLGGMIKTDNEVEMNDLLGRFTTDVIGTCAFGIECNSLKDPNATFRQMGKKVFDQPKLGSIGRIIVASFPALARMLGMRAHHKDVTDFFLNAVKETVAYREQNNIKRNDFMDLLINLKNNPATSEHGGLTIEEIAAQAFVFFLAGFETSSTTLTYCLYELGLEHNKHIQDKARNEIFTVLSKYNGELTYDAINEMVYIEQIINETLRKFPPAGATSRVATKNYPVPGTNYTIPKGTLIFVPIYAVHHDPEIYENPKEFNPDRFSSEAASQRPTCGFLPFGEGPRNCIGLRFGMLQARIGLVKLLQNFEFAKCDRTLIPMEFDSKKIILSPNGGTWLKVTSYKK